MDIEKRNERSLVLEIVFFGVLSGIVGSFLSVFALRLGASSQDIGLLSALPALVTMVWMIPASALLERYRDILRPALSFGFLQRLQYVLFGLVVLLPAMLQVPALLTIVALGALFAATGSVAFTVMFGLVVPESRRAHLVSRRNLLAGLTAAAAAIIGGKMLEQIPFPWNYSFLFLIGFAFSMVSLFFVSRIVAPPVDHPAGSTRSPLQIRQAISTVRHYPRFTRFTAATFVANIGMYLPIPLYSIYWVKTLNMGEWWIGLITTVGWVIPLFTYPLWARAAGRFGNRAMLTIGCIGLALFPWATALAPSQEFLLIPAILGGIFNPPWSLGLFNGLFEVIPPTQQPTFISFSTAVTSLAAFAAPMFSTIVLVPLISLSPALLVGAAMRAIGGVVVYIMVQPDRQARAAHGMDV